MLCNYINCTSVKTQVPRTPCRPLLPLIYDIETFGPGIGTSVFAPRNSAWGGNYYSNNFGIALRLRPIGDARLEFLRRGDRNGERLGDRERSVGGKNPGSRRAHGLDIPGIGRGKELALVNSGSKAAVLFVEWCLVELRFAVASALGVMLGGDAVIEFRWPSPDCGFGGTNPRNSSGNCDSVVTPELSYMTSGGRISKALRRFSFD